MPRATSHDQRPRARYHVAEYMRPRPAPQQQFIPTPRLPSPPFEAESAEQLARRRLLADEHRQRCGPPPNAGYHQPNPTGVPTAPMHYSLANPAMYHSPGPQVYSPAYRPASPGSDEQQKTGPPVLLEFDRRAPDDGSQPVPRATHPPAEVFDEPAPHQATPEPYHPGDASDAAPQNDSSLLVRRVEATIEVRLDQIRAAAPSTVILRPATSQLSRYQASCVYCRKPFINVGRAFHHAGPGKSWIICPALNKLLVEMQDNTPMPRKALLDLIVEVARRAYPM